MLEQHYPFPSFRPFIKEALTEIDKAVANGKRFIILRAPTGSGKSAIGAAFARQNNAVILTPTKLLQNQYADTPELDKEWVIFGKSNYLCGIDKFGGARVDEAICCSDAVTEANKRMIPWSSDPEFWKLDQRPSKALKKKCAQTGACPYYSLISQIGKRPGAVLNYDLFVHTKQMPNGTGLSMGSSLAMDEAHQLIGKMRSVFGYKISNTVALRVLGDNAARKKVEEPLVWMMRLVVQARAKLKKETDAKIAGSITRFINRLDKILSMDAGNEQKFHIDDNGEEIEIKPLDFRHLKEALFYPFKHILMMSATFPNNFCELLGITKDEAVVINIPSTFPSANRPAVLIQGMPQLNYKTILDEKHPTKIALDIVLEKHPTDKGIVHCANYKFFNQLRAIYKKNPRFLWVDREDNKTELLERHSESKIPTILVSPSMMEGIDLKDDLARFQVLLKVPFPTLDDYTRKMMAIFPNYYENLVITSIVQAYGRAVRSEIDHATFYLLDGSMSRLLAQHRKLFPKYLTEALTVTALI